MTNEMIIIEKCIEVFNVKKEEIKVVKRLMGGMSNYTYVIEISGKLYTFRIPGKNAEKFVNRTVEKHNIELVEDLGLNNKTVYFEIDSGFKIAEYIEGTPLHELEPYLFLNQAAAVLSKIHNSGKVSDYDYDPLGRLKLYEGYLAEYDFTHSERYLELKAKFLSYSNKYMDKSKLVLSHGDSQISNFVVTGNGLRLMDWEFTGNNDPYYDIACFGNNDFDHALALLPVYLRKTPTVEEYNRLYFFRAFQTLQWHNVALYKEFIGLSIDLGVDFMFVANLYLDKAEKFLGRIK
ncbi:MAG: Choline/ethanolamine kinase [Candidatus Izimaplasma bacterium HR2]|nr:MAG: Choline/ethanolamine kinase [Candidatus Izimaplasma bacterium HR2]